ncbi:glycosyltransferase family 2 protein [Priestia megaterium]
MTPKVSIIIPVYNCEKYISKCLESVLSQTYLNIEIVIINDGSTDNTEKIINNYKEKDNRIMYYYQANRGPSEARNKGILNSTSEYLIFIDSDDTVDQKYVELLINEMVNSKSDLVCCGYKDISEYGIVEYTDFNIENSMSLQSVTDMVCKGTGGVLWSKIFKKEIILKHSLKMDKRIFMCEDLVFVLQYVSQCKSFSAINDYLYHYNRLNENSISSNISIDYVQNFIHVWKAIEKIVISVNKDRQKTSELIGKRIQEVMITLIEEQSRNIRELGMKNASYKVGEILEIPYIKAYKGDFSTDNYLYKPYIFFMKVKFIKISIIYGIYLSKLRSLKKNLKKRK